MDSKVTASIEPRDLHFPLHEVPRDWHPGGVAVTAYWDQLSIFFPVGEGFFVKSVRHFLPQLSDPKLVAEVAAFCAQEGFHAREHVAYNERLAAEGLPIATLEKVVKALLGFATRVLSPRKQLAITCALEHYTSLMGESVLSRPEFLGDAHPVMARLWRWHAAEEHEHRSVAFDTYLAVGGTWFERSRIMLLVTLFFWGLMGPNLVLFFARRGVLFSAREWWRLFRFMWVEPSALGSLIRPWASYFARDFHPSSHGNAELLSQWKASLQP
ncbi:MAG: metal-dependent hydrolase [Myxococcaceae bacterium]